jgi:hypothetical protein
MATRNVSKQASALARARERRRALDQARDEQDRRVEEATAAALVAWDARVEAQQTLDLATGHLGDALRVLMAQDTSAERAAALLELDASEIRRLAKATAGAEPPAAHRPLTESVAALPAPAGGENATRRAG